MTSKCVDKKQIILSLYNEKRANVDTEKFQVGGRVEADPSWPPVYIDPVLNVIIQNAFIDEIFKILKEVH